MSNAKQWQCSECGCTFPGMDPGLKEGIDRCTGCIERQQLRAKVSSLYGEIKRMHQWVDDLQSGMYVNCIYCGHRYCPVENTPVSMANMLKKHVMSCSKHPMSQLKIALSITIEELQKSGNHAAIGRIKHAMGELYG